MPLDVELEGLFFEGIGTYKLPQKRIKKPDQFSSRSSLKFELLKKGNTEITENNGVHRVIVANYWLI